MLVCRSLIVGAFVIHLASLNPHQQLQSPKTMYVCMSQWSPAQSIMVVSEWIGRTAASETLREGMPPEDRCYQQFGRAIGIK